MLIISNLYKSFGEKPLFRDFNLELKDKQSLCIMGSSGCGKTTLLNLLAGVYSIKQIKEKGGYFRISEDKKEDISYLYNPAMLFNGTVRENIVLTEIEREE